MNSDKDEYFMKALREGYRARSAYKLIQLAQSFDLFKDVKKVIDLCAAPGSWSQVISNELHDLKNITEPNKIVLKPDVKIVAIDLAPIRPIPGVVSLVADITEPETCVKLTELFQNEKVDLILCDGAHDVSGMELADFQLHLGLITACIHTVLQTLKDNGSFVAKIFDTWGCQIFISQLRIFFKQVYVVKPHSSRSESYECYAVCKKYTKPKDFDPSQVTPYLNYDYRDFSSLTGIHKLYIPFLVLGHYDIEPNEFKELQKEYGDDLYEKIDMIEELLGTNELSDLKKSLMINEKDVPNHEKFVNRLLNKGKFTFGTSRKLFILYLNKNNEIDFHKVIGHEPLASEAEEPDTTEIPQDQSNSKENIPENNDFITQLFEGFLLEQKDQVLDDFPKDVHPWFVGRNLDENNQEFEDFDLDSIIEKTDDEVMKILKENNGNVPEDLSKQFSLLENPNGEILKLVKERRDTLEKIQKIVEENKF